MPSTLAALLCLGLCLSQMTSSTKHTLLKPIIWAKPSFIIAKGRPVTIWCQGFPEAVEYHLLFKEQLFALKRPKSCDKVTFSIPAMTLHHAGPYRCIYLSGEHWSQLSEPLDLIMTGMYDTPTLSVQPRAQVTSGENVTFHCHLESATNTFFLLKEGRANPLQQTYGKNGADFSLSPVTPAHRGTYRCFGSYNNFAWSFPSEPMKLFVAGSMENTSPVPTETTFSDEKDLRDLCPSTTETRLHKEFASWDLTAQNLFRIGIAVLILMAMVGLLVKSWCSRKKTQAQLTEVSSGILGEGPEHKDHSTRGSGHR
ncbi:LOW QUALITY PROTEIN: natural cytotoxicity triggering receptor 1 [Echinops telfairi]|uniref:LOW QUALITY PROTEIN: natural cytotoxicity triggering receptor 1 n=1 Tax=Echinops telfairi TaxID=9371 RepID=A0AC55D9A6_ECHTE|nr:LOW QUALITY PROTEIN: natural cytotoxicity triggering receptor 1 [Echinops telfairi]